MLNLTPKTLGGVRFIDLFAGMGGFHVALESLGAECVFASEWDRHAQDAYERNFGTRPAGDITQIVASAVPDHDVLCGGFPCFPAGTLIQTRTRMVPIEDVRPEDEVLTHEKRWRKVVRTMKRNGAPLLSVKVTGVPAFRTTEEHPFYVRTRTRTWDKGAKRFRYAFGAPEWVDAKDLTGDHYAALPIDDGLAGHTDRSQEFWYLVGRWLGDGWIVEHARTEKGREHQLIRKVLICTSHADADDLLQKIKAAGFHATRAPERTVTKFHISSHAFVDFLAEFGRGAGEKQVPAFVFDLPIRFQRAVLDGWVDADGHRDADGTEWSATSINRALSLQMARLARNVSGIVSCVNFCKVPPTKVIEGRTVNQKSFYTTSQKTRNHGLTFIEGGYAWVKVKSVTPTGEAETVYNFEVEEDNSYVAEGVVVHNCQAFSISGKRKGFEDTRGTLFFDVARIIREKRPKAVFLENVKNFATHDGGRTMDVVRQTFAELGYVLHAAVLNPIHYGVPQKRERVYLVAFREDVADAGFTFPQAFPLTRFVEDFLMLPEETVAQRTRRTDVVMTREPPEHTSAAALRIGHVNLGRQGERVYSSKGIAITFSAYGGGAFSKTGAYLVDGVVRRLHPREAARIMGYPDTHVLHPNVNQAYKQLGNSVIVDVLQLIAQEIGRTLSAGK